MKNKLYSPLIIENLKSNCIISIIAVLTLCYILPFNLYKLIQIHDTDTISSMLSNSTLVLDKYRFIFFLTVSLLPIMVCINTFSKMYKGIIKTANTSINFSNLSKTTMFISNLASSSFLVSLPIIISLIATVFVADESILVTYIFNFYITILIYDMLFFATTILVAVTVKGVIPQLTIIFAISMLPLLIEYILFQVLDYMIFGVIFDFGIIEPILKGFPLYKLSTNVFSEPFYILIVIFLLGTAIILFSGYIFIYHNYIKIDGSIRYKKGKGIYQFVFFLFLTLVNMIVAKGSLVILLICSFFNYFMSELLINNSFNIKKTFRFYLVFTAISIIFILSLRFDLYNVTSKVPYINDVNKIYIGTNYKNMNKYLNDDSLSYKICIDTSGDDNIKIRNLDYHTTQEVINSHINQISDRSYAEKTIYYGYNLKDGTNLIRRYKKDKSLFND